MSEYVYLESDYKLPTEQQAPKSILEFVEALAPIAKYYAVLLLFYFVAKRVNQAVETESNLEDKERKRPNLSTELMESSSDEESEDESEEEEDDEIYEELTTDGARLVSVPGAPDQAATAQIKKTTKKSEKLNSKVSGKSHPLFEGLKKVEEELRQQKEDEAGEASVSWNELHKNMLKRYQQKYPEHGLRIQESDDYDDEFKELLEKHNVRLDELKKEQ